MGNGLKRDFGGVVVRAYMVRSEGTVKFRLLATTTEE